MIGGRSSERTERAAYWPTPWRSKTVSVRIAPPPITPAKSSAKSVAIGIIEFGSTCLSRTRRGLSPFAFAVRT